MRAYELLKESGPERERCVTCDGLGKEYVGDEQLGFTCPDCKGEGYFDKKEELEEIKVTKTLAGKRTKPSQDLATKAKMTKKKKDSKGKVVKDASTPMNRNVHDLANITLKGEYRS
jgi:DnaJ-class molecular chaperone